MSYETEPGKEITLVGFGHLTVLSFVPDVLFSVPVSTTLTLIVTHLVAAAIVIPALACCLPERASR